MSKFLQALEQAEHDQALRRATAPPEPAASHPHADAPARPPQATLPPAAPLAPSAPDELDEHLVSLLAPSSFEAEQYRALRQLIEERHKSAGLSVIAVSSPGMADGKTTTAINLAGTLAQAPSARVLLIDGDLRAGALARRLRLRTDAGPGLVDAILDRELSLPAVVRALAHVNLSVLPAGRLPGAPYEVLKSPGFGELLAEARARFDYIVVDTPPLVSVPDCRVIEKWVDGFLIVVTAHRTSRRLLEEALKVTEPTKIVGLVFNGDDRHLSRGTYSSRQSSARSSRRHSASDD